MIETLKEDNKKVDSRNNAFFEYNGNVYNVTTKN